MITGFDILFFWLARMVMFGCHFMQGHHQDAAIKKASGEGDKKNDSVPFRHVYIHALVRDADRQKMSKTKGNVVDPLDIIQRFGTDATRFTLAAMAAPGTDIAFNESRTEGYRAFANKIWNAARFMFMNVDRIAPGLNPATVQFTAQTLEDRWIRSRLNDTILAVNSALSSYRFDHAAATIYDFFWGEFCDWYLEMVKPRLIFKDDDHITEARIACGNLVWLFDAALRLLHPIMPFITEEIWQALWEDKPLKSIALASYPESDGTWDRSADVEMLILQDLIVSIRNVRAELKVEPKAEIPIEIFAHEPGIRSMIERNRGAVERLANVEKITFVGASLAKQAAARSTARFDVHVIYERKIDVTAECERLKKELEKIEKGIASSQRQLGNEQFLAKAPANVVEGLRKQRQELAVLQEKAQSKLAELGCG
jgi:valyl-tRNA synthetase